MLHHRQAYFKSIDLSVTEARSGLLSECECHGRLGRFSHESLQLSSCLLFTVHMILASWFAPADLSQTMLRNVRGNTSITSYETGNFVNSGAWLHKVRLPCLNLNSWFMRFTFLLVDASRVFLCFMEASALVIWLHGLQLRWDYLLNDSRKFAQPSVCHVNNLQRMPTSAEAILCLSHPAATYRNQERLAATDFPNNFAELRWC